MENKLLTLKGTGQVISLVLLHNDKIITRTGVVTEVTSSVVDLAPHSDKKIPSNIVHPCTNLIKNIIEIVIIQ